MSEPLIPERTGDLAELGLTEHPTVPLDEMAELEEEAQAATAAEPTIPEPEAPQQEPPEDQAQPPDAEPVESVQEESILESVLQQDKAPEQAGNTRLEQENARLMGLLEGRLQAAEDQIRQSAPSQEPQPESVEESLLESAPVRQVLAHLKDEDPQAYEAALVRIAKEEAVREMNAKFESLESSIKQREDQEKQEQQATLYQQGIHRVMSDIEGQGGVESELIQQLRATPEQSYLGARFKANPAILMSEEGIRGAVMSVAAELKAKYEAQQSTAAKVSPSVEASAGGGSPSTRGVSLGEKPKEMSEEERIIENMMNAGGRTKSLPFLG